MISRSSQVDPQSKTAEVQTDLDFYYYFESKKIYEYKTKIIQL
jgi:hypothetical protein